MKITGNIRQLIILWLLAIPQFLLGLGITKFLGNTINWSSFWLGLVWVILMGLVSVYLFLFSNEMLRDSELTRYKIREKPFRNWLLAAGLVIALLFISTMSLLQMGLVSHTASFLMLMIFLGTFFIGVQPFRIYFSGLGEIVMALAIGFFIPALSLQLQIQDLHRLLTFSAVPITLLLFSFQLASQIEDFGTEARLDEKRLAARIGWENAFLLHNSFMIIAYLALGLAGMLGMPQSIALPVFISFPMAGLQIWHLQQIANGRKPSWKFLKINNILIITTVIFVFVISYLIR